MITLNETFAGPRDYGISGGFFRLLAGGPLDIKFWGVDGGPPGEEALQVTAGFYYKRPFDRFRIVTSAGGDTIKAIASDGDVGIDTFSFSSLTTVAGAPQGTDKESSDGRVFSMFQADGIFAAINSSVELFNPIGSTRRIYVDETFVYTFAASQVFYKFSGGGGAGVYGLAGANAPVNFNSGSAVVALGQLRFGNGTNPPATQPFDEDATPDQAINLKYMRRSWPRPLILDANEGLIIMNTTVNQGMQAGFRWREF